VHGGLAAGFAELLIFQLPFNLFLVLGSEIVGVFADLALQPQQVIL